MMTQVKEETNTDCLSRNSPSWQGKAHSIHPVREGESLPAGLHRYICFACKLPRRSLLARVFLLNKQHGGQKSRVSHATSPESSCTVHWSVSEGNGEVQLVPPPTGRFPRESP